MREHPVVVTGASGFLGTELLAELERMQVPVLALSRAARSDTAWVRWIRGDLRDPDALRKSLPRDSVIFHLGAQLRGPSHDVHTSVVEGTRNVLRAATERRARLVHVSSLAVLNPTDTHRTQTVDETTAIDDRPEVRGAYSQSKVMSELMVREWLKRDGAGVVVRPGQLLGSGLRAVPASVGIPRLRRLLLLGAPSGTIPVVHVADAAAGLVHAAATRTPDLLHLVDECVSRTELIRAMRLARVPGAELPVLDVHILASAMRAVPGRGRRMLALDTRADFQSVRARELGWSPCALDSWLQRGAST